MEKTTAKTKNDPGIDNFKLIAALLVIAIHTSPLASLSPEADFILTRILARVAVPFFFMVAGYFVLPKALIENRRALLYLKRIGLIYLASVLLYLPINLYAGHFAGAGFAGILKMLLLDGTFYHLWYLPAMLLGFALTLLLLRRLPLPAAAAVTGLLYLIGLFGDSYYGLIPKGSFVLAFYDGIFHIFEYTRNGIFYTPVFLLLGYLCASRPRPAFSLSLAGLGVSSALILTEGVALKLLAAQRHDSMYLALLPLMYFLFCALLESHAPNLLQKCPKDLPLLVYLLHPLFLILVRGGARLTGLSLLIDNSLLHFLAVAAVSFAGSWGLELLWALVRKRIHIKIQTRTGELP